MRQNVALCCNGLNIRLYSEGYPHYSIISLTVFGENPEYCLGNNRPWQQ